MFRQALELGYSKTISTIRGMVPKGALSSRASWFELLYLLGLVALSSGSLSAVFTPPSAQGQLIYPGPGAQTIPETFLYACTTLLGASGIYIAYLSGRYTTKPRSVNAYLAVSMLLLTVSVIMGMTIVNIKG